VGVLEFRVARSYYGIVNSCIEIDFEGKLNGEKMERGQTATCCTWAWLSDKIRTSPLALTKPSHLLDREVKWVVAK
jgi:hypothetical protein